eukprot:TRINITY_DN599_c0_g1_i3.p1 TRINITY_DN599_c0_g1~~TRINITY_DN599_c0_g1_i3.p1  ORF type:complete len:137 (+),score=13.33 TRINITY_DN599_c0_g1_i3:110-520(+)
MSTFLPQSPAVLLPASVEVVHEVAVHELIRVNAPQKVKMCPLLIVHLMVHTRDNVRKADDGLQDVCWHGKPVIISPVESNWGFDSSQVIVRDRAIVVLEVQLVTSPVIPMESTCSFKLSILQRGSVWNAQRRGVVL